MRAARFLVFYLFAILIFQACGKEEIDDKKPEIDINFSGAFPVNCDTIYFGEPYLFNAVFKDNAELGAYSIEVHHNFDHHAHSTEVTVCELWPVKPAVNPYVFIKSYSIPSGSTVYAPNLEMVIPTGNANGEFDEGDYHFFISLTDKEGWSTQKGLSIKILKREL